MSMVTTTLIQMIELIVAYLCLTIFLPHFVLGKTLRLKNRYEKFMLYSMAGNFYAMNLVFVLELLHIAYPVIIIVFTVVPCVFIKIKLEHIPVGEYARYYVKRLKGINDGSIKVRAIWRNGGVRRKSSGKRVFSNFVKIYLQQLPDVILILGLLAILFFIYGYNHLEYYGYKASDIIVHNYWINCMGENNIFCTGIYPYGFHCIVFYLRCVFGFDTFVILRLVAFVQTVWVYLVLLCFLKLICKSKYAPYIGTYIYSFASFFKINTYSRFAASLPQEYGMMFILPAAYCLIAFFREQRRVDRGAVNKRWKMYLSFFTISFAMTLSVHFYGTAIAGMFCVAIALGYSLWFFRGRYFRKIMISGLMALFVAIAPMGVAYIGGTPLQGSLMWGLSIISGSSDSSQGAISDGNVGEETEDSQSSDDGLGGKDYSSFGIFAKPVKIADQIKTNIESDILYFEPEQEYCTWLIMLAGPILVLLGALFLIKKKSDSMYGAALISCGVMMFLMFLLVDAYSLGIPAIMDPNRSSVYFSYCLPVWISLAIDGVCYFIWNSEKSKLVTNIFSFIIFAVSLFFLISEGKIREPIGAGGMEMNDAVITLSEIIAEDEPFKWTIVSANDENRMASDSGYHYEIMTFLRNMENVGAAGTVNIPTEHVYVFIEKKPLDYYVSYWGSGQNISDEGCNNQLPLGDGLDVYQGENRWVVMSRAYAWAQEFMSLYPNEVSIFNETDDFVCYRIEQNPYRLFNFAIDYGYNLKTYPNRTEAE